jgi:PAS domain S-box-containing protein
MATDESDQSAAPPAPHIPPGGTATAAHAHDWAATPLGPMEQWPPALKVAAGMVLGSNIPMVVGWGPDLLLVHNDSYGEVLGDRGATLGRPIREAWAASWDVVGPNVQRIVQGETIYLEAAPRVVRRDGRPETAWLTFCYNPLRDEKGEIVGIFGVVTAVSGDARTEQRIRESEERFRLIADSAPALMWVTKLDRTRNFVNRAYVDFLGITYEEAVDFDWRTVLHPDDQDRIVRESLAGEASLEPFVLEARYRRYDGAWRWVRSISQPRWGPGGEHIGFIGVAHDITEAKEAEAALEQRVEARTAELRAALDRLRREVAERERAEEALRQAQKMEAVGRLTGGIAHDFNNLLTPVIGGLEILAASLEEPRLKRLAEAALDSSRRGAKLTTQLLTFSRIQRIKMGPVSVNQVIENLRQILGHTIGSGVAIRTDLAVAPLHALCDENQLENAILNLAINARDAMPEGGTLTLSTEAMREEGAPDLEPGEYVAVTVVDTGVGMSAEIAARATEPFFSTKPIGKGTGLGLAQVYGIARQAGGTMRIDSREGAGTTVRLILPRVDAVDAVADSAVEVSMPKTAAGPAARVMLVDDDPDVRLFLTTLLDELGHDVEAFEDAEAALAGLDGSPPDLMLLDFAMPKLNGAQLARIVRERYPDLPIVFITGYAESEQLEGAAGADVPVLRKPFGMEALSSVVADALDRQGSPPGD